MRRAVLVVALAAALVPAAGAATPARFTRTLASDAAGPYLVTPDRALTGHAAPGFEDLRIADADGRAVPWRLLEAATAGPQWTPVRVLDAGRQGGAAVAVLDLGAHRAVHSAVRLEIPAHGFVGRVSVFGEGPRGRIDLLAHGSIWDLNGAATSRNTVVEIPPTDLRFLDVNVTGVPRIAGAAVETPASAPRLAVWPARTTRTERRRTTVLRVGLGLPLDVARVRVTASTPVYSRPVAIAASTDGRTFYPVAAGQVERAGTERSSTFDLDVRARVLRIAIANGDDAPLAGVRVRVEHERRTLLVRGGGAQPYRLSYGARRLAPDYDFGRVPVSALGLAHATPATLGPEERAAAAPRAAARPRDFHWLLDLALALSAIAVAAVGVVVLRRRTPA